MYTIVVEYNRFNKLYVASVAGDRDEYYGYAYGATAQEASRAMGENLFGRYEEDED